MAKLTRVGDLVFSEGVGWRYERIGYLLAFSINKYLTNITEESILSKINFHLFKQEGDFEIEWEETA